MIEPSGKNKEVITLMLDLTLALLLSLIKVNDTVI